MAKTTRAQNCGIHAGVIVAGQRRTLASIRKRLVAMGLPWEDIDGGFDVSLQELLDAIDTFDKRLIGTAEYFNDSVEE